MKNKVYDCLIIGAGVVGASIFNKLVRIGKSVVMIDKASDVATGASKANSGLIHAGFDPLPKTLKAKLNVRGNKLYPDLCERLKIKLKTCGALVVGDDKNKIQELYDRGKANGVKVEIWDREKIVKKVPDINENISVALFAPDAKLISPYLLTISLVDEGILNGGKIVLEEDLVSVKKDKEFFEINTKKHKYFAKNIINSAGCGYNDVAKILGSEEYLIQYRRGEYFVFDKDYKLNVDCTIFPLPTKLGKGVLITPTIDGNYLIGPTSENGEENIETTLSGLDSIKEKASLLIKGIDFGKSIRQFAGVRTIVGDDFVLEKSKKIKGVINIAGICSPGLSSAPAIAEYVLKLLNFKNIEKSGLKTLTSYKLFKELDINTQNKLCKKDENYKKIICKCENITKGDVMKALNRPLKIHSVDGVKRRTNAGMGRCQGGFCFTKVISCIMEATGLSYEEVLKENRGSNVAISDIREVNND